MRDGGGLINGKTKVVAIANRRVVRIGIGLLDTCTVRIIGILFYRVSVGVIRIRSRYRNILKQVFLRFLGKQDLQQMICLSCDRVLVFPLVVCVLVLSRTPRL